MGLEAYLVDDIEEIKQKTKWERNHLTLLAANETGFKNLVKLSSAGFLEGFARGKANVDPSDARALLGGRDRADRLPASRFCRRLVEDRPDDARAHVDDLLQIFGPENVYFELQVNGIPEQDKANEGIARVARELGRPLVGTADVHYLRREDYHNHAALLCVQTKSTLEQPKLRFDTNEFYLKTAEEMAEAFAPWPEAVPNTLEIAERCNVEIQLGELLLPRFPTPDGSEPEVMLRRIAEEGLRKRLRRPAAGRAALERLEFELGVIEEMGFPSYFLIVWDFVRYAKDNGVAVGPGRGSAAGSIVAYSLGITDLDPLANDLLFERFLNPARRSMPDIDIDFSVRGRERVIRYVGEKYGRESVAQIITFGTMAPRAGDPRRRPGARLRLRGRRPGREADPGADHGPQPELRRVPRGRRRPEEGLRRRARRPPDRRHGPRPRGHRPQQLDPRRRGRDRRPAAAGGRAAAARRGSRRRQGRRALLQDRDPVLDGPGRGDRPAEDGLPRPPQPRRDRGRGRDHRALPRRVKLDVENLPLDDAKTYEMLTRGDSIGVFQLESEGMREAMKQVKPTEFDDIVALVCALPARGDEVDPRLRARQAGSRLGPLCRTTACGRSPRRPTAAASTRSS